MKEVAARPAHARLDVVHALMHGTECGRDGDVDLVEMGDVVGRKRAACRRARNRAPARTRRDDRSVAHAIEARVRSRQRAIDRVGRSPIATPYALPLQLTPVSRAISA